MTPVPIMRPLVMDFPADNLSRELADEYMFGPAFLVAPVTEYKARTRAVRLPDSGGAWYDFWTGRQFMGAQTIDAPAPYDAMPLFVRAGSIIPTGPAIQYTGEKPAEPITLRIYTGANGSFSLYEDDGVTYDCDHGAFTRIPLKWDDGKRELTIGERQGKYPGMLASRTFNLVLVSKSSPTGYSADPTPDTTVSYSGKALKIKLN